MNPPRAMWPMAVVLVLSGSGCGQTLATSADAGHDAQLDAPKGPPVYCSMFGRVNGYEASLPPPQKGHGPWLVDLCDAGQICTQSDPVLAIYACCTPILDSGPDSMFEGSTCECEQNSFCEGGFLEYESPDG